MIKKSVIRVLPFIALLVFLLDRISLIEDSLLRISGFLSAVIGFSVIYTIIEYMMYRKVHHKAPESLQTPVESAIEIHETELIEELASVEEENEFGELIEVEDQIQQPFELIQPDLDTEPDKVDFFTTAYMQENIEELEVLDESIEELEPIDD